MDNTPKKPVGAAEEEYFYLATLEALLAADVVKPVANAAQIRRYFLREEGVRILDLELFEENPLSGMLVKSFDPQKADEIFLDGDKFGVSTMQQCVGFRSIVYGLADEYPECLWVQHSLKRMAETGFKDEVVCFWTATFQTRTFMNALNSAIIKNFDQSATDELSRLVSEQPYTNVYVLVLMQELSQNTELGNMMKHAMLKIRNFAKDNYFVVEPIVSFYFGFLRHKKVYKALSFIVSSNVLNLSDLAKLYWSNGIMTEQASRIMKTPLLIDLLVDSLFRVDGKQDLHVETQTCMLGCVWSTLTERSELTALIANTHRICKEWPKRKEQERADDMETLLSAIHKRPIAACVLRWIEDLVTEPHYFSRCSPVKCIMDLVHALSTKHSHLHRRILHMLIRLFEGIRHKEDSKTMKTTLHERLTVLTHQGYEQAGRYIDLCYKRGDLIVA